MIVFFIFLAPAGLKPLSMDSLILMIDIPKRLMYEKLPATFFVSINTDWLHNT
jgi:hypothetical protein